MKVDSKRTKEKTNGSVALEPNDGASVMNAKRSHHVKLSIRVVIHIKVTILLVSTTNVLCVYGSAGNVFGEAIYSIGNGTPNRATMLCL